MQEPRTFGECLSRIMREKNISVADLARRMNYRSKTSISRLLKDEVRYASIEDFMKRLEPMSEWLLTGEEMDSLNDSMEVSRLGRARYRAYRDIWRLVSAPPEKVAEVETECIGSADAQTLHEIAERWNRADKLEFLITNSGYESLFRELGAFLRQNPHKDIQIRHYFVMRGAPGVMAEQMGAVMNVFHDARYQGYYRPSENPVGLIDGTAGLGNHMVVVRGEREDGGAFLQVISMRNEACCLVYENDGAEDMMLYFRRLLEEGCRGSLPLKTQYPEQELLEGLTVIGRRYLGCEQDRGTCCLAPDICFELIPLDILCKVMFDSLLAGCDPESEPVQKLYEIQQARYKNIHGKRKSTVFMFTWDGLVRFSQTGRTTDYIAGMRAFTPDERAAIIRDVVGKCRENGYMRIYILKPDINTRGMTLITHEGLGVYLLDSYTQYDLAKGHSEAFIFMPDFSATLDDFFRDVLIGKHTYSEAESLDMLENLAESICSQKE